MAIFTLSPIRMLSYLIENEHKRGPSVMARISGWKRAFYGYQAILCARFIVISYLFNDAQLLAIYNWYDPGLCAFTEQFSIESNLTALVTAALVVFSFYIDYMIHCKMDQFVLQTLHEL